MSLHLLISYSYYYFVVFLFSRSTPKYIRYYTTSFSSAEVTKNLPGITPHVFLFSEIKDKPATIIMFLFIRDTKKYAMHATCPSFPSGTPKCNIFLRDVSFVRNRRIECIRLRWWWALPTEIR